MVDLLLENWDIAVAFVGITFSIWLLYFSRWKDLGTD